MLGAHFASYRCCFVAGVLVMCIDACACFANIAPTSPSLHSIVWWLLMVLLVFMLTIVVMEGEVHPQRCSLRRCVALPVLGE